MNNSAFIDMIEQLVIVDDFTNGIVNTILVSDFLSFFQLNLCKTFRFWFMNARKSNSCRLYI